MDINVEISVVGIIVIVILSVWTLKNYLYNQRSQ